MILYNKVAHNKPVNLTFICTHNSRRSHLAQVWAQFAASYYAIPNVMCYSGGTEVTAVYPTIVETFQKQGFTIATIAETKNPIYAIKYHSTVAPIIAFSKKYDDHFNPSSAFAAVMTCSQADDGYPYIAGAEKRIPVMYNDPKVSDNTPEQSAVYANRSLQIATEMMYIFSQINT